MTHPGARAPDPAAGRQDRGLGPGGRAALRALDAILHLYPPEFRRQLGDEVRRSFAQRLRIAARLGGRRTMLRRSARELAHALRARWSNERAPGRPTHPCCTIPIPETPCPDPTP